MATSWGCCFPQTSRGSKTSQEVLSFPSQDPLPPWPMLGGVGCSGRLCSTPSHPDSSVSLGRVQHRPREQRRQAHPEGESAPGGKGRLGQQLQGWQDTQPPRLWPLMTTAPCEAPLPWAYPGSVTGTKGGEGPTAVSHADRLLGEERRWSKGMGEAHNPPGTGFVVLQPVLGGGVGSRGGLGSWPMELSGDLGELSRGSDPAKA